jgi:hypothetical protein
MHDDARGKCPVADETQRGLRGLIAAAQSLERLARAMGLRAPLLTAAAAGARLSPLGRERIANALRRWPPSSGRTAHLRLVSAAPSPALREAAAAAIRAHADHGTHGLLEAARDLGVASSDLLSAAAGDPLPPEQLLALEQRLMPGADR